MYVQYHKVIRSVLKKAFVFSDTEDRSTFCCYGLFCVSCFFIFGGFVFLLFPFSTDIINIIELPLIRLCGIALIIVLLFPYISLSYRRCNDIGGHLLFWLLIISSAIFVCLAIAMWKVKELQTLIPLIIFLLSGLLSLLSIILLAIKRGK